MSVKEKSAKKIEFVLAFIYNISFIYNYILEIRIKGNSANQISPNKPLTCIIWIGFY